MRFTDFPLRFSVNADEVIFALGPVGFISFNSHPVFGPGTFTCWLDLPGGAWEFSLGEPLFGPRDPEAPPLLRFYPYK